MHACIMCCVCHTLPCSHHVLLCVPYGSMLMSCGCERAVRLDPHTTYFCSRRGQFRAELEAQTNHLRARAAKADSNSEALAEARAALTARDQQLQEASDEIERLRDLAQVGRGLRGGSFSPKHAWLRSVSPNTLVEWLYPPS
jgi:hypothetical protein